MKQDIQNWTKQPVSSEELESVNGGQTFFPKKCPKCGKDMYDFDGDGIYTCSCGYSGQ